MGYERKNSDDDEANGQFSWFGACSILVICLSPLILLVILQLKT
jgi:hypothetical protein